MGNAGASGSGGTTSSGSDDKMLAPHPSWTCGMPDGIPPPATGKLVFEANVTLGQIYDVGDTQFGHRHHIEITGGTVKGPNIDGTLRTGGLDWQLTFSNGAVEDEEVNIITTSSGASIYFRNCGTAAAAETSCASFRISKRRTADRTPSSTPESSSAPASST